MKEKLPIRKRLRIKYYDYTKENMYFVTICIKDRLELLGKIKSENNVIELTKEGNTAKQNINNIEKRYENIIIDEYVVMPNHIHMILIIKSKAKNNLSRIIKQYKRSISKEIGYSIWQKSFYEHIIRNEKEYMQIKEYIQNNIKNWKEDKYF